MKTYIFTKPLCNHSHKKGAHNTKMHAKLINILNLQTSKQRMQMVLLAKTDVD